MSRADSVIRLGEKQGHIDIYTYDGGGEQGYQTIDVEGYWDINPLNPKIFWKRLKNWLGDVGDYFEYYSIGHLKSFRLGMMVKELASSMKDHPLKIRMQGWVWVVSSMESCIEEIAEEMAMDQFAQAKGYKDSTDMFTKTGALVKVADWMKRAEEIKKSVNPETLFYKYCDKYEYKQEAEHLWVSISDPTVFVVSENFIKFDLEKGWSFEAIAKCVSYWIRIMYNKDMTVRTIDDTP